MTEELIERAAKRADAMKAAKVAALLGDYGPARELAGIEEAEAMAAQADADAAGAIEAAGTGRELAALAPRDVLAPLPFGAPLPTAVLWQDTGPKANPEHAGTVLCRGEVAMLSGPGEGGKSTVCVALADAARDGGTACGLHVARGKVAVLSYEDSGPRLAHRFEWYAPQEEEWEHVRRARGAAPLWEADPERCDSGPSAYWRPFWDAAADFGARLVAIDPASVAAAGMSPSDGAGVRSFLLAVTTEAAAMDAGVLIVAHDTKAARNDARAGIGPGPGAISGSGQWSDGARSVLHLSGAGPEDRRLLTCAKSNYGPSQWGARLAPKWDGPRWRGLTLDSGEARLSRERVEALREEWAKAPKPDTATPKANGGDVWRTQVVT